jgi:hypothetical protein
VLRIDGHGYSPAVLDKIVTAGGSCKSFQHAAEMLNKLAEIHISHTQVARLTHEVGLELVAARNAQARQHRYRQLEADPNPVPVELACVEADGGRILTRAPDQSRGVHEEQWKESKVGVLWRMTGATFDEDPHAELPRCFQDRDRVPKLVREIHGSTRAAPDESGHGITLEEISAAASGGEPTPAAPDGAPPTGGAARVVPAHPPDATPGAAAATGTSAAAAPGRGRWQPQRVFRTCVATLRDVHGFGPLLAAEAQRRGFYAAKRRVFLGDGQESNWTVQRLHFSEFTAVTDFMHAVAYAYPAAQVLRPDDPWGGYVASATACWQGRVHEVIAELEGWLAEHPLPENVALKEIADQDPRKIVHESLTYFRNNRQRMQYPQYRRQGMPVTSSLIESLIKEINWRVKGTEKYWNRPQEPATSRRTGLPVRGQQRKLPEMSAESILQIRAALLGHDERLEKFLHRRPGNPFVRRSSRNHANTAV